MVGMAFVATEKNGALVAVVLRGVARLVAKAAFLLMYPFAQRWGAKGHRADRLRQHAADKVFEN